MPLFDVQKGGKVFLRSKDGFSVYNPVNLTKDEFINELSRIHEEYFPDSHIFEVLKAHFFGSVGKDNLTGNELHQCLVCPRGLIGDEPKLSYLHTLEEWARLYHVLPDKGCILDQKEYIFEAFNIITHSRNYFENKEFLEMEKKIKSSGSKKK